MDSRARNRKVTILQLVDGQDDIGQPTQDWAPLASVMANIRHLRGLETIKADAQTAIGEASINIAYRTNVTTAMRVKHGAMVYEITAVLPDEAGRKHVDLTCKVIA